MSLLLVILLIVTIVAIGIFFDFNKQVRSNREEIDRLRKELVEAALRGAEANRRRDEHVHNVVAKIVFLHRVAVQIKDFPYERCRRERFPHFLSAMRGEARPYDTEDPTPFLVQLFVEAVTNFQYEGIERVLMNVVQDAQAYDEIFGTLNRWLSEKNRRS